MGLLSSLLTRSGSPENPANPITTIFDGPETVTGENLSTISAMNYSGVRACQRVLSESVASLPCLTYRRQGEGKVRARDHALYSVLHDAVNPEMSAFTFFEVAMVHLTGWGNFYAEIVRTNGGAVKELWPLNPERTKLRRRENGERYYEVDTGGQTIPLRRDQVFHVIGVSLDGVTGISMLHAHRNAVAIGLALEKFTGKYFANDAMPGGILEHPSTLKKEAHDRLRESWEGLHKGLDNKHRIAILEEGMKLHEIGVNLDDAQLLPLKRFQLEEICRLYRVPLHLVNDLERATYNNIDILDIGLVKHTLRPWLVRFEQAIRLQLMTPKERIELVSEFLVDAMERGDPEKRGNLYAQLRQNGIVTRDEIRAKENLNPTDEPDGFWMPSNMTIAGQPVVAPAPARSKREVRAAPQRLSASFRPQLRAVVLRILRAEEREIAKALKASAGEGYRAALESFIAGYYDESVDFVLRQLALVLEPFGAVMAAEAAAQVDQAGDPEAAARFTSRYVEAAAGRYTGYSREALLTIVREAEEEEIEEQIAAKFDAWKQSRGDSVAKEETVRLAGAVSKFVFLAAGVSTLRWFSTGEDCPACESLNGAVVGIESPFIAEGQSLDMGEGAAPLKLSRSIGHPPLHRGCDCFIGPG